MVEVSGLAVATVPLFIKEKFGQKEYEKWLNKLDPEVRVIYKSSIVVNQWFDLQKVFVKPVEILCDVFYNGDYDQAWQFGRYSADYGLKGVLKVFVTLASVNYFIKRASAVFPNYYRPINMDVPTNEKGFASIRINEFPEIHKIVEYRIGGWMERALEITSKNKNFSVEITKSLASGDDYTEFQVNW